MKEKTKYNLKEIFAICVLLLGLGLILYFAKCLYDDGKLFTPSVKTVLCIPFLGKVMDKFWKYQYRFDAFRKRLPELKLSTYLFCVMMICITTGLLLFIYILVNNIPFNSLHISSDPLTHIGIGVMCGISYIIVKYTGVDVNA